MGIGMGHSGGKFTNPAKALMDIDQKHYPESMLKMYLVNVPWVFKMIWKVVRPWLHPVTQEKIHVCGSDFLKELQADGLTLDQLPECIGGTGSDKLAEFEQAYFAKAERASSRRASRRRARRRRPRRRRRRRPTRRAPTTTTTTTTKTRRTSERPAVFQSNGDRKATQSNRIKK